MARIYLSLDEFSFLHEQILQRFVERQILESPLEDMVAYQKYGYGAFDKEQPNILTDMQLVAQQEKSKLDAQAIATLRGKYLYDRYKEMEKFREEKKYDEQICIGNAQSVFPQICWMYLGYTSYETFLVDFTTQQESPPIRFVGYAYYERNPHTAGVYTYAFEMRPQQKMIAGEYRTELTFLDADHRTNRKSTGRATIADKYLFVSLYTTASPQQYSLTLFCNGTFPNEVKFMRGMLTIVSKDETIVSTQIFFVPEKSAEDTALVEKIKQQLLKQKHELRLKVKSLFKFEDFFSEN